MNIKIILSGILLTGSMFMAQNVYASGCFKDPIYEHDWTGEVTTGAFVRDVACMEGSEILTTLPVGTHIAVNGETDGWWRVRLSDGTEGWVGQWLISIDETPQTLADIMPVVTSTPAETTAEVVEEAEEITGEDAIALFEDILELIEDAEGDTDMETVVGNLVDELDEYTDAETLQNTIDELNSVLGNEVGGIKLEETLDMPTDLFNRVKGRILLQVEQHGEAWYVDPETRAGYYMKDGETAYEMMRSFGLGVSEVDYAQMISGNSGMINRLRGRIILRVEEHGEAYYIHPETGALHYLRDGNEAYRIMRELSLGVTDSDLKRVSRKSFAPVSYKNKDVDDAQEAVEDFVELVMPDIIAGSNIKIEALNDVNEYWLAKVNNLRAARGLRLLENDERFIDTAMDYAEYMVNTGSVNHERADGSSMHEWIGQQGLEFSERYSDDGWNTNYFTENIAWNYVTNDKESIEEALDRTMDFFLSEEYYNGAHYRTQYHADWNSVGVGIAFKKLDNGKYKAFFVFHYGSLANVGE